MKKTLNLIITAVLLFTATSICKGNKPNALTPEGRLYEIVNTTVIESPLEYFKLFDSFDPLQLLSSIQITDIQYNEEYFDFIKYITFNWGNGIFTAKMDYLSKDVEGNPDVLSGRLYVRNDEKDINGIIIANHFTIGSNTECPSENAFQIESIFSLFGYAVVMADYIGFGVTVDDPHPYLHWNSTAQASIDAYLAARQYLENQGYTIGDEIYNMGYSQGGHTSMSVIRMAEENYPNIHFTKSFLGAGPYNIKSTYDDIVANNFTGIPCAMPMIMNGLDCAHHLGLNLKEIFIGEMLGKYEYVLNKRTPLLELFGMFSETETTKIFNEFMFDKEHPVTEKIIEAAQKSSPAITWMPKKDENIFIFHSTNDNMVPFVNSYEIAQKWGDGYKNVEYLFDDFGGHASGALAFYVNVAVYFLELVD